MFEGAQSALIFRPKEEPLHQLTRLKHGFGQECPWRPCIPFLPGNFRAGGFFRILTR